MNVVRSSKPAGPLGSTRSSVGDSACTRRLPTNASCGAASAAAALTSENSIVAACGL